MPSGLRRGRVERLDEAHAHPATKIDSAARIAGLDFIDALPRQEHGQLVDGDERGAGPFADFGGVANMVVMPVGQHHMRGAVRGLIDRALELRVLRQKRVDQNDVAAIFRPHGGMPEPCKLHRKSPPA